MRQLQPRQDTLIFISSNIDAPWFFLNSISSPAAVGGSSNSRGSVDQSRRPRDVNWPCYIVSARTRDTSVGSGPHLGVSYMSFTTTKQRLVCLLLLNLAVGPWLWTLALHVESKERPGLGSCRVRSTGGGLLRGLASLELYMGLAGVCWPWFACLFARDIGWRMVHGGPEIRTRAQYPTHQT